MTIYNNTKINSNDRIIVLYYFVNLCALRMDLKALNLYNKEIQIILVSLHPADHL